MNREALNNAGDFCYFLLSSQGWTPQELSAEEIAERIIKRYIGNLEMQRKESKRGGAA